MTNEDKVTSAGSILIESVEIFFANAPCKRRDMVDIGIVYHRVHSSINIPYLEFVFAMAVPQACQIEIRAQTYRHYS